MSTVQAAHSDQNVQNLSKAGHRIEARMWKNTIKRCVIILKVMKIQAEGVFANLKQDYGYTRLHRRGKSGVKEEIYLEAIGYNVRKYHYHKHRRKEEKMPQA